VGLQLALERRIIQGDLSSTSKEHTRLNRMVYDEFLELERKFPAIRDKLIASRAGTLWASTHTLESMSLSNSNNGDIMSGRERPKSRSNKSRSHSRSPPSRSRSPSSKQQSPNSSTIVSKKSSVSPMSSYHNLGSSIKEQELLQNKRTGMLPPHQQQQQQYQQQQYQQSQNGGQGYNSRPLSRNNGDGGMDLARAAVEEDFDSLFDSTLGSASQGDMGPFGMMNRQPYPNIYGVPSKPQGRPR
jgi:hypothetical protein